MKKFFFVAIFISCSLLIAIKSIDISSLLNELSIKDSRIDFGYLIQPYDIGNNNLSKSFIYCVDVKNKMMVSAEPHIFIKKDELKGERHADIRIIFNEKIIPAGETRTICLQLTPPKERLNDGVYNTFGAILLNKTKALGFRIKYNVISAVQGTVVQAPDDDKVSKLNSPQLIVDDKTPLVGFAMDFTKLANDRYIFDKNFLNIFEVDSRSTCNFKKDIQYEISQDNNKEQCYFFFTRKQKGESSLTIRTDKFRRTQEPIKESSINIKLIAK